jgi:hypothetical protein
VANEITKAGATFQKMLAALHLKVAQATIAKIEAGATGPEQALKLDQAAGQPVAVILADQQTLLGAYSSEASQLRAKMAASTGKAQAAYKTALAKIRGTITSTQDSIVQSLQSIATTAQAHLQTIIGSIQTAADAALGQQYSQGGLQTPSEALLAQMQSQDTKQSLQDALATAITAADPVAIAAAQRAITENDLATKATAERAAADAAYAKAQWNLDTQIQTLSANVGTGAGSMDALNKLLGPFGISLAPLADLGGNGLLTQLQAAVAATTSAFWNVSKAMGGSGAGSVSLPGGLSAPSGSLGSGFGGGYGGSSTTGGSGGAPVINLHVGTLVGSNGMQEFTTIIAKNLNRSYLRGTPLLGMN